MTRLIFFILILSIPISLSAQKQDITLEEIWKEWKFSPKYIRGFKSMNDGEHYSTIEKKEKEQQIVKYTFKTGKKVKVLFKSSKFKIEKINNYTFSDTEKKYY